MSRQTAAPTSGSWKPDLWKSLIARVSQLTQQYLNKYPQPTGFFSNFLDTRAEGRKRAKALDEVLRKADQLDIVNALLDVLNSSSKELSNSIVSFFLQLRPETRRIITHGEAYYRGVALGNKSQEEMRSELQSQYLDDCRKAQIYFGFCGDNKNDIDAALLTGLHIHFDHIEGRGSYYSASFEPRNIVQFALNAERQKLLAPQEMQAISQKPKN